MKKMNEGVYGIMMYLILAIACSTLISVLMHVSEKYSKNSMSMLAMNYGMCCVMASIFAGATQLFPASSELPKALGFGAVNGVLYLGGFVLLQWNTSKNGIVLPATFMKLGVLVPTILSIVAFGETPRAVQILGILAAIGAILLINGGKTEKAGNVGGLILLLLVGGSADAMSKIYEELGPVALKNQFLLYTFAMALILCVVLCVIRKQSVGAADILFGLALGVPNYFSARFLLLSLQNIPAVVAYPSFSVGTIILTALIGTLFLKETLNKRKIAALGVILVALALLNI